METIKDYDDYEIDKDNCPKNIELAEKEPHLEQTLETEDKINLDFHRYRKS